MTEGCGSILQMHDAEVFGEGGDVKALAMLIDRATQSCHSVRASRKNKSAMTRVLGQATTLKTIMARRWPHRSIGGPANGEPSPARKTAENSSVL